MQNHKNQGTARPSRMRFANNQSHDNMLCNERAEKQLQKTIFVYATKVNDFRTADYNALSMLIINSAQEFTKRLMNLEDENTRISHVIIEIL